MEKIIKILLTGIVFLIYGCGAGESGDGGIDGSGQTSLSGTAAVGVALKNTKIFVQGKNGNRAQTKTDSFGKFNVNVSSLTPPYIIKTTSPTGKDIFSISHDHGLVNVHPLSDLVTRNVTKIIGKNISEIFNNGQELVDPPSKEDINISSAGIQNLLSVAYKTFSVNDQFDLIHSEFNADGAGFDGLLDYTNVTISVNAVNITLTDPITGIQSKLVENLDLGHDFSVSDTQAPSIPGNPTAVASSDSAIKLVWDYSTDNIGVAGYKVRRITNGPTIVATVAVSTFEDFGLVKNSEYCYTIEAVDGAGNTSGQTNQVCATTLGNTDVSAPLSIASVTAAPLSSSSISLAWPPSTEADVIAYRVYRKIGTDKVKLSTVLSPGYTHQSLDSNTEYCYEVSALDAANNESDANSVSCATTSISSGPEVDEIAPVTVALPKGGSYDSIQNVQLVCADFGGAGCDATYYTLDGSTPTTSSNRYNGALALSNSVTLKFFSRDKEGNAETVNTESYTIVVPDPKNKSEFQLEVVHFDSDGSVVSNIAGISCGLSCDNMFAKDATVVLTASHTDDLIPLWTGCEVVSSTQCSVVMNRDRRVLVNFVTKTTESADNDSFATAQLVLNSSVITGYLNSTNDADFYKIEVTSQGSFMVSSSHPTHSHYLNLYNESQQNVVGTYGTAPVLTQTLSPGTYYVRVYPTGQGANLDEPYTLKFEGTVMGGTSPDQHEENDLFTTATLIESSGRVQGYLDTANDPDFFKFVVSQQGTFMVSSAHPTHSHYVHLYNEAQQSIVGTYGTAPVLTQTLSPGTYYVRVYPTGHGYNLNVPYTLKFEGTVMGDTSPDTHEQNDLFSTAVLVETKGSVQGYLDTANDPDFFKFVVSAQGTFKLSSAHPTHSHYINLYNEAQQNVVGTYGTAPVLTQTLSPGTYYVRVYPTSHGYNLNVPYTLKFEGTVMGDTSPDTNEQNDLFSTAKLVETAGSLEGYLDTANDPDFFKFVVSAQGTFKLSSAHPTHSHYINLYNEAQQNIVGTSGTAPELTQTLSPGTYYVRVYPTSHGYNLNVPYTLKFEGTVMGDTSPDANEQNDLFSSATMISVGDTVNGYMDTVNDPDYFQFTIGTEGSYKLSSAHPTKNHRIQIFNGSQQSIVGSTVSTAPQLVRTLTAGTYYALIIPNNTYDLNVSYTFKIEAQ